MGEKSVLILWECMNNIKICPSTTLRVGDNHNEGIRY